MKSNAINRRSFLKLVATCCLITPHVITASFDINIDDDTSDVLAVDPEFVIINGWVLLKSDAHLKDGI